MKLNWPSQEVICHCSETFDAFTMIYMYRMENVTWFCCDIYCDNDNDEDDDSDGDDYDDSIEWCECI